MKFVSPNKHCKILETKITNTATLKIKGIPLLINKATFSIAKSADLFVTENTNKSIGYVSKNSNNFLKPNTKVCCRYSKLYTLIALFLLFSHIN